MPRRIRIASGGYACHVLNRAVGRARIFSEQRDFEEAIRQANERLPMGSPAPICPSIAGRPETHHPGTNV